MMLRLLLILLCFVSPTFAAEVKKFPDPEIVAKELIDLTASGKTKELAQYLGRLTGQDESATTGLEGAFGFLNGKVAELSDRVHDKSYGTAIRQMIYLLPYPDLNFVYVRMNFKRMGGGWILSNYQYTSETQALFPGDIRPE